MRVREPLAEALAERGRVPARLRDGVAEALGVPAALPLGDAPVLSDAVGEAVTGADGRSDGERLAPKLSDAVPLVVAAADGDATLIVAVGEVAALGAGLADSGPTGTLAPIKTAQLASSLYG